jgi:PAS domain S-box-containing protein
MNQLVKNKEVDNDEHFMVLVNNLPDSISQLDRNFRYVFVNKTILELTKESDNFFVGQTIYELGLPEKLVLEQEAHLKLAFEKGERSSFEIVYELPKIGPRTFHITVVPVFDKGINSVATVLQIAKDITNQKEFEGELNDNIHELQELSDNLANKNRQLQDFAYIVAHNLRSPMNNLVSLIKLHEIEKTQGQKEFLLQKIAEVTESFSKTIEELTHVVKTRQEDKIEFQSQKFQEVIEHIKKLLNTQISEANATITCDFSQIETIQYPIVYLESILLNLITNSIKYRSDKRELKIHISSQIVEGKLCLSCKDNGIGLDLKKYGDQIFGMNKTFHFNSDSRGMGLFITRNQIESLGGSITIESQPDNGATFLIVFR